MRILVIQLGKPEEVFTTLEAISLSSLYGDRKNSFTMLVRNEFLNQYPIASNLHLEIISIGSADIVQAQKKLHNRDFDVSDFSSLNNHFLKPDIVFNLNVTQASIYFEKASLAGLRVGPQLSVKNKLVTYDEWAQSLLANVETNEAFGLSRIEIYLLIFERVAIHLQLKSDFRTILTTDYIEKLKNKNDTSLLFQSLNNNQSLTFSQKLLVDTIKQLSPSIVTIDKRELMTRELENYCMAKAIKIYFLESIEKEKFHSYIETVDYFIGAIPEYSSLLSLYHVPSLFFSENGWVDVYKNRTYSNYHFFLSMDGWNQFKEEDFLLSELATIIEDFKNLELLEKKSQAALYAIQGLSYQASQFTVTASKFVSAQSALAQINRVLWSYYFFQTDFTIANDLETENDKIQMEKALQLTDFYIELYEHLLHFSVKSNENAALNAQTPQEAIAFKNKINEIYVHIQKLNNQNLILASTSSFFRAKLSAQPDHLKPLDVAQSLILNIQEALSCYKIIKELITQTIQAYQLRLKGITVDS